MNTALHILNLSRLPPACLTLAISTCFNVTAADVLPQDTSAALQRPQERLDRQTKRIDRLCRALGPHLEELEECAAAVGFGCNNTFRQESYR